LSFSLSRALSSTAVAAAVRQLLTRSLAACAAVMVARGIVCAACACLPGSLILNYFKTKENLIS